MISSPSEQRTAVPRTWREWAAAALTSLLAIATAFVAVKPLWSKQPWMLFEEDDFFYYLQVAHNLVHGAGSTFNSLVPTNGYHPLWLLVLTAVSLATSSGTGILIALAALLFVATMATYLLSRRLLAKAGVESLTAAALAAYVALYAMHLFYGGMEVTLTIPLLLGVVLLAQHEGWWLRGFAGCFTLGLLLAAMVLSRLDSMLFAGMLFIGLLATPRLRIRLGAPQIGGLAAGLSPIVVYLAINRHYFHTWLPVSGMAKQLKFNHLPSSPAWMSFFGKTPAQLLNVVPIVLAMVVLPTVFKRLSASQRVLYPVLLAFPFVHLLMLSCVSDWRLWGWYFYAFRTALMASFVVLCLWQPAARLLQTTAVTGLICLVVVFQMTRNDRGTGGQDEMYDVGVDLRGFAQTHPGVYAMGDRSGMVGYMLPDPLVQTEGLMMDKAFVEGIAHQLPLRTALESYHVRYYIGTSPNGFSGCFDASEPFQAGPNSPHMRAVFCEPPVATFTHGTYRTMVYDLSLPLAAGDR